MASRVDGAGAACLRVLVNIDITGSMGNELEGVKRAVAEFSELCSTLDVPVNFAVCTFTESNRKGCFVSLEEFRASEEAVRYVQDLQLSTPPDAHHVTACGDDGPENQKAALFKMCELDPAIPTVAFLITDDSPHMQDFGATATSKYELDWLQARGLEPEVAKDLFRVFAKVLNHFGDNLILNCVLYGGAGINQAIYGSLAQRTGGMLMQPSSRSSSVLAKGLMTVVKILISRMPGQQQLAGEEASHDPLELHGFSLMDVRSLPERNSEKEPAGEVRPGENAELFQIAMERMVAVCGSKWAKRAMGITAPAQQLEFVWRAACYVAQHANATNSSMTSGDGELAILLRLRESIVQKLPPDAVKHFTVTEQDIKELAKQWADASEGGASLSTTSAISLESVEDVLKEGSEDLDDLLHAVMKLLHGYPIRLQLPKDKYGNPDFMDAWSAVLEELGCDRLASSEFLQLLGPNPSAPGLTDRGTHNAFLIQADPSDKLASLVLTIASGTQVLNYATGVLMGAPGFLPNLYPGTVAACLMRLLCQKDHLSEFQLQQAKQMVHALRCLHKNPAPGATRELRGGVTANPEDNISKLIAALIRLQKQVQQAHPATTADVDRLQQQSLLSEKSTADMDVDSPGTGVVEVQQGLRLVLEEWVASLVQRYYGKRTPETDKAYLQSLVQYMPPELLLMGPVEVDPLQQLHPLELPAEAEGVFRDGWEEQLVTRLDGGITELPAHPAVVQFKQGAQRLLELFYREGQFQQLSLADVWPDWESDGVLTALLLRQRTARYSSSSAPAGEVVGEGEHDALEWKRVPLGNCQELARTRLKEALADQLEGYRRVRQAAAEEQLLEAVAEILLRHAKDETGAVAGLRDVFLDAGRDSKAVEEGGGRPEQAPKGPFARLLNGEVSLGRSSVPAIVEKLGEAQLTPELLKALVVGEWTTSPPQALRRAHRVRALCQQIPDCKDLVRRILAMQLCYRAPTTKAEANRHGHNVERQYPGPDGWTSEYAAARLGASASGKQQWGKKDRAHEKISMYLCQMQQFTQMANWARGAAAGVGNKEAVERILAEYRDANSLPAAQKRVEELLGQAMHAV